MSLANQDNLGCLFTYLNMRLLWFILLVSIYLMSFGTVKKSWKKGLKRIAFQMVKLLNLTCA